MRNYLKCSANRPRRSLRSKRSATSARKSSAHRLITIRSLAPRANRSHCGTKPLRKYGKGWPSAMRNWPRFRMNYDQSLFYSNSQISATRESLASRDKTLAELRKMLADRDALLSALAQRHAKAMGESESRNQKTEEKLQAAQRRATAANADLDNLRTQVAGLQAKLRDSNALIEKLGASVRSEAKRAAQWHAAAQQRESKAAQMLPRGSPPDDGRPAVGGGPAVSGSHAAGGGRAARAPRTSRCLTAAELRRLALEFSHDAASDMDRRCDRAVGRNLARCASSGARAEQPRGRKGARDPAGHDDPRLSYLSRPDGSADWSIRTREQY